MKQRITRLAPAHEIVLGVVFLGGVSMLVGPRIGRASQTSQEAALADCLRYLRTQIAVYARDHHGVAPGYPRGDNSRSPDDRSFLAQLTQTTDEFGHTLSGQSPAGACGPYLAFVPANPLTLRTGILVVPGNVMPQPDQSQPYGWFYCPHTRQIMPNLCGADAKGVAYRTY
jgi:hypothetical protein